MNTVHTQHQSSLIKLSTRELEILKLFVLEYSAKEIANHLFISPYTVITHRNSICRKLNVKKMTGMVREAFIRQLI